MSETSSGDLTVLHIVSSSAFAGLERHVLSLSSQLRRLGVSVQIGCPPAAARLREEAALEGIPVFPGTGGPIRGWRMSLARRVCARTPDLLHLHDGRSTAFGVALAGYAGANVVRTQHFTRTATTARRPLLRQGSVAMHRALNRRVDGYIAVSQAAAEAAFARSELGCLRPAIIPPGIQAPPERLVARAREFRATADAPVITYVGRLEPEKRLETLIDAIPLVRREIAGCRFVIAGSGSAEQQLKDRVARVGIADAVEWPGWVSEPDAILGRSHIYVNTWPWEGFGMAMAEAMTYELPVVAPRSGSSPEVVVDGETGLLVAPEDPTDLAAALVRLVSDNSEATRMGQAGRRRSLELFTMQRTAEATLAFYREVLRDSVSAGRPHRR